MSSDKLLYILLFITGFGFAQKPAKNQIISADINLGYNLARIETNYLFEEKMPYSFQVNWQKANYYDKNQLSQFGYSDLGLTFLYHDFRDNELGKNYGIYAFMEYYLIKPVHKLQLSFRVSQGLAYNTNPYNKFHNSKNKLFGSHWLFPFDIALYLKIPKIYGYWGLQAGLAVFHYSNGNLQSPNYGANIPSLTLGVNYDMRRGKVLKDKPIPKIDKALHYVAFMRFGCNESDYYDSGIFPFFIPGFQVEKHLNFRHKFILGTELFLSYFLREQIRYEYYSIPEYHLDKIYDFKRLGVFFEHEFYYKSIGINTGIGYYIYYPYHFETRLYNRLGVKYYINRHWTALYSLKVHSINRAEAMEFGIMYRL
jgi:hypothetical protein